MLSTVGKKVKRVLDRIFRHGHGEKRDATAPKHHKPELLLFTEACEANHHPVGSTSTKQQPQSNNPLSSLSHLFGLLSLINTGLELHPLHPLTKRHSQLKQLTHHIRKLIKESLPILRI